MSSCRFLVGDVFEQLALLADDSIDFVFTSPPFIGLREYLPSDHPSKPYEIGLEATPAAFIDVMLRLVAALDRVLAPHGSIGIELGDTYSESGGAGGDYYNDDGWRSDQPKPRGSSRLKTRVNSASVPHGRVRPGLPRFDRPGHVHSENVKQPMVPDGGNGGVGWPLAKSKALMPELLRVALAYGLNPLTGEPSPAGRWRVRNVVHWVRTNPPVGALGDKFRPASSDIVFICRAEDRYWDEVSIRVPASPNTNPQTRRTVDRQASSGKTADPRRTGPAGHKGNWGDLDAIGGLHATRPPYDWWVVNTSGYDGDHFAAFPEDLVKTPLDAMCPRLVCTMCGAPRRPIVETVNAVGTATARPAWIAGKVPGAHGERAREFVDQNDDELVPEASDKRIVGWTHCACFTDHGCRETKIDVTLEPVLDGDGNQRTNRAGKPKMRRVRHVLEPGHCENQDAHMRRGHVLDPFGGSGTTGAVAVGNGRDATLIDLDERNVELAAARVGPLFFQVG